MLLFLSSLFQITFSSPKVVKILSICSDLDDVSFTHVIENMLRQKYPFVEVKIYYLNKGYDKASEYRSRLSDVWFLRGFDQIWIFDFNPFWAYGDRLSDKEIYVLSKVVSEGRVLVIGYSTFISSWSNSFESFLGVKLLNYSTADTVLEFSYGNKVYKYNSSFGLFLIDVGEDVTLASFSNGWPAIVEREYGYGRVYVFTFNPVKWALESYVGIGFPNGKWYVRVDLLVKRYQPKNVEELIKVLSWVVLEEVCHSLGWLHRKGCEIEERNFLWKLINYSS